MLGEGAGEERAAEEMRGSERRLVSSCKYFKFEFKPEFGCACLKPCSMAYIAKRVDAPVNSMQDYCDKVCRCGRVWKA